MLSSSCSVWTTPGIPSNMLLAPHTYNSASSDTSPTFNDLEGTFWSRGGELGETNGEWCLLVWVAGLVFLFLSFILFALCWVHLHGTCMDVGGHLVQVSSFFQPCGFWESNSCHQAMVSSPTEPACQAWGLFWLW